MNVGQPGQLIPCCFLTSHQGTCGHCCYCKLSLASLEGCGTAVVLGAGVFKAGWWNQPGNYSAACSSPQRLVRSSLMASHLNSWGPRASSALLSPFSTSWTGQTSSELLFLFGNASKSCCSWCIQILDGFGTGLLFLSKGSRKKKFKTKNSSGCV